MTQEAESPLSRQQGGSHYKGMKIQPVEFIHAAGATRNTRVGGRKLTKRRCRLCRYLMDSRLCDLEIEIMLCQECGWKSVQCKRLDDGKMLCFDCAEQGFDDRIEVKTMAEKKTVPQIAIVRKKVDGGRNRDVGLIECPYCGHDHYTADISTGQLRLYCDDIEQGGYAMVEVIRIL